MQPTIAHTTGTPWERAFGYVRARRVGPFVSVSGTLASDAEGRILCPGDAAGQTREALLKIERSLAAVGATRAQIVRTRIYVVRASDMESVGRAHGEFFAETPAPACTMVAVAALASEVGLVEIEADAIVSDS